MAGPGPGPVLHKRKWLNFMSFLTPFFGPFWSFFCQTMKNGCEQPYCRIISPASSESESQLNLETWNIFQTGTRSECDSAQIWLLCCRRLKNGSEYKITTTLLGNAYFLGVSPGIDSAKATGNTAGCYLVVDNSTACQWARHNTESATRVLCRTNTARVKTFKFLTFVIG